MPYFILLLILLHNFISTWWWLFDCVINGCVMTGECPRGQCDQVTGVQSPRCPMWRWERGPSVGIIRVSSLLLSARLLTPNMDLSLFVLPQQWGSWWWENAVREDIVQNNIPREWEFLWSWNFAAVIFSTISDASWSRWVSSLFCKVSFN